MAPRLREELVATKVEEDGVTYVDVADPASGNSFRFYDFEFALAEQLRGQPLAEVVAWANDTYGLELTTEALDQFVEKLAGLGFLAVAPSPAADLTPGASPTAEGPDAGSGPAFEVSSDSTTVAGGPTRLTSPVPEPVDELVASAMVISAEDTSRPVASRPRELPTSPPVAPDSSSAPTPRFGSAAMPPRAGAGVVLAPPTPPAPTAAPVLAAPVAPPRPSPPADGPSGATPAPETPPPRIGASERAKTLHGVGLPATLAPLQPASGPVVGAVRPISAESSSAVKPKLEALGSPLPPPRTEAPPPRPGPRSRAPSCRPRA